MPEQARPVKILLVQDDPVDEFVAREDLADHKVLNSVVAVHDARSAIACLNGTPPFVRTRTPDVVLLDPELPWPGGDAVLEHLRTNDATAHIPVILLADSPAAEQILRSRRLPVHGYARKPFDFACLVSVVRAVPHLAIEVRRR